MHWLEPGQDQIITLYRSDRLLTGSSVVTCQTDSWRHKSCIMLHRDTRSWHLMGQTMLWYKWDYLADKLIKLQSGIIGTDSTVTGTSVVAILLVARQAYEDRLAQWQLIPGHHTLRVRQYSDWYECCCYSASCQTSLWRQTCPVTTDTRSSHLTGQTVLWWYKWCHLAGKLMKTQIAISWGQGQHQAISSSGSDSIVPGMTIVWVAFVTQQAVQVIFTE